jgi:hypothetical protein
MANYTKQLQKIVADYRKAGMEWPAPAKAIAEWAVMEGRWQLPPAAVTQRCAEDIARAMREEYMTDAKGRRVRVKHPVSRTINGEQYVLWDDIRTAPRSHMQMAFQQRRLGIVGDCRQLKTDVDSYNDARPDEEPIQMVFDFTMDLLELEAARAA